MGGISDESLERILKSEVPRMRPMSDEEIAQAYDELQAEGNIGPGVSREDFIAEMSVRADQAVEAQAAGVEPVAVPEHLREQVLARAQEVGASAAQGAQSGNRTYAENVRRAEAMFQRGEVDPAQAGYSGYPMSAELLDDLASTAEGSPEPQTFDDRFRGEGYYDEGIYEGPDE
jgi:hypothetical protein